MDNFIWEHEKKNLQISISVPIQDHKAVYQRFKRLGTVVSAFIPSALLVGGTV